MLLQSPRPPLNLPCRRWFSEQNQSPLLEEKRHIIYTPTPSPTNALLEMGAPREISRSQQPRDLRHLTRLWQLPLSSHTQVLVSSFTQFTQLVRPPQLLGIYDTFPGPRTPTNSISAPYHVSFLCPLACRPLDPL